MNKLLTGILCMYLSPAFAGVTTAKCVNTTNTGLIEDKVMNVKVNKSKVEAVSKNYKLSGKFVKVTKNGSYMYESSDVSELADQTDYGYIFVTPGLVDGENGNVTFSTRQLGDSEGSTWLSETFKCKVGK